MPKFKFQDINILDSMIINKGTISVKSGSIFYITGPNGCGKSTILKLMLGISEDYFNTPSAEWDISWDKYGYVEQKYENTIFPWLSVYQNVQFYSKWRLDERLKLVSDITSDVCKIRSYQNSGGIKQRLAISKELGVGSGLILLDEPFSSQDLSWLPLMQEIFNIFCDNGGVIGIVTHLKPVEMLKSNSIYEFIDASEKGKTKKYNIEKKTTE